MAATLRKSPKQTHTKIIHLRNRIRFVYIALGLKSTHINMRHEVDCGCAVFPYQRAFHYKCMYT